MGRLSALPSFVASLENRQRATQTAQATSWATRSTTSAGHRRRQGSPGTRRTLPATTCSTGMAAARATEGSHPGRVEQVAFLVKALRTLTTERAPGPYSALKRRLRRRRLALAVRFRPGGRAGNPPGGSLRPNGFCFGEETWYVPAEFGFPPNRPGCFPSGGTSGRNPGAERVIPRLEDSGAPVSRAPAVSASSNGQCARRRKPRRSAGGGGGSGAPKSGTVTGDQEQPSGRGSKADHG